jgi:hypothetical protein
MPKKQKTSNAKRKLRRQARSAEAKRVRTTFWTPRMLEGVEVTEAERRILWATYVRLGNTEGIDGGKIRDIQHSGASLDAAMSSGQHRIVLDMYDRFKLVRETPDGFMYAPAKALLTKQRQTVLDVAARFARAVGSYEGSNAIEVTPHNLARRRRRPRYLCVSAATMRMKHTCARGDRTHTYA